jgi:glycosyltransferase involved in cell wall biosynthesis
MISENILYVSFDELSAAKGASIHIAKFVEALKTQYQLTLLAPFTGDEDRVTIRDGVRQIEIALPKGNLLDRIKIFRYKLARHLEQNCYRVIQFRSIWEGRVAADLAGKANLIYEINGLPSIELKYHYPGLGSNQSMIGKLRRQELMLMLVANLIITPSSVTKSFIESFGINGDKIKVIPNGADPDLFRPGKLINISNDLTNLIYVGTLAPWQGLRTLLLAMKLTKSRIIPQSHKFNLTLIGPARKSWLKKKFKLINKYKLDGTVKILNSCTQEQIANEIALAEIAVAPLSATDRNTLQGCSPIKLFEYAACAKAIIASDLPAVREIFTDGKDALLYNPRKPSQLRDKIVELATDPSLRSRLGSAARELIIDRYTWKHAQSTLLDCYKQFF